MYGHLLVMAIVNIVLPFTLITVGEQSIDSALAVDPQLDGAADRHHPGADVPAGRARHAPEIAGLSLGFAGVILLVAPDLVNLSDSDITGELMMIGSSLCYGIGNVYSKRNVQGLRPTIPALFQVAFAAAIMVPLALARRAPDRQRQPRPGGDRRRRLARDPGLRVRLPVLLHDPGALGCHADVDGVVPAARRRDRARRGRHGGPGDPQPPRRDGHDHRGDRARQQRTDPEAARGPPWPTLQPRAAAAGPGG